MTQEGWARDDGGVNSGSEGGPEWTTKILSLWELMQEYKLDDLALMLGAVIALQKELSIADVFEKDGLAKPELDEERAYALGITLDGLAITCQNFDGDPSLIEVISRLSKALIEKEADRRHGVLCMQLRAILTGIQNNLKSRKFMFLPADEASYWNKADMFGMEFLDAFPKEAILEMREAGNCFAANRGTACVFHCIRVAEYGLRKLARKVRATITHTGKKCPLEYGDWDTVITAIKNKIAEARKLPRGPQREKLLQFYSDAADHCLYMKDIVRNEIAHTRRRYNKAETLGVINRVGDFVRLLSRPMPN